MAWFIKDMFTDEVSGPFDDASLKRLAAAGKIVASTEVSRSQSGPWANAARVRGLFDATASANDASTHLQPEVRTAASAHGSDPEHAPNTLHRNRHTDHETEPAFFMALFDSTFHYFVTPRITKILFRLLVLGLLPLAVIGTVGLVFVEMGPGQGVVALLLGILWYLISVLILRLGMETVLVLFRIEHNTRQ